MALTVGSTVPGSTTLSALVDMIYANKTGSLTGASATFTALDANRIIISWPSVNAGDNVIHVIAQARGVVPASIRH